MNLSDAAMIAQIAGTVLVVPTLLYLALQVRQNTKQLKAAARYQFVEATGQVNAEVIANKQAASVFRRGLSNYADLDADERIQFPFLIGQHLQIHSVMFELHEDALLTYGKSSAGPASTRNSWPTVEGLRVGAESSYDMTKI